MTLTGVCVWVSLTWALSLSGWSSSSSPSDAARWPENTERSLTSKAERQRPATCMSSWSSRKSTSSVSSLPRKKRCRMTFTPPRGAVSLFCLIYVALVQQRVCLSFGNIIFYNLVSYIVLTALKCHLKVSFLFWFKNLCTASVTELLTQS